MTGAPKFHFSSWLHCGQLAGCVLQHLVKLQLNESSASRFRPYFLDVLSPGYCFDQFVRSLHIVWLLTQNDVLIIVEEMLSLSDVSKVFTLTGKLDCVDFFSQCQEIPICKTPQLCRGKSWSALG